MRVSSAPNQRFANICFFWLVSLLLSNVFLPGLPAAMAEDAIRPRIGLVLGGGGAKGTAHIGVLQVLEELRIPVDYIAGTSMGAIVGSLYASGLSPDAIKKTLTRVDWEDIFTGDPDRRDIDYRRKREDFLFLAPLTLGVRDGSIVLPKGLVKDQKINNFFRSLLLHAASVTDFDNLPIPFRAVATDLETGEMVILKSGRLAEAARASMSVPGAFPPIEVDGRILIDGGLVRNLPIDIVRGMGADVIIAVDVGQALLNREELGGPLEIMNQMLDIMISSNVREQIKQLDSDDIYLNPDLGDLGSGDFARGQEGSQIGYAAARNMADSLARYSVSREKYEEFLAGHRREQIEQLAIADIEVQVESQNRISSEVVADRFGIEKGDTVDLARLVEGTGYVFGMGDFDRVDIMLDRLQDEGSYDLLLRARDNSLGPNYLRFGVALESNIEGTSSYNILLDYTRRWINAYGAEWKTLAFIGTPFGVYTEFYQPLSSDGLFFIMPYGKWIERPVSLYKGDERVAEYSASQYSFGFDIGIQPWMYGIAKVGLLIGEEDVSLETGDSQLLPEEATFSRRGIIYSGTFDQLDNVHFPNEGSFASVTGFTSLGALGADESYSWLEGSFTGVASYKRQTFLTQLSAGSSLNGDLPFHEDRKLGGFLNLSGLQQDQLRGDSLFLAKVVSYYKAGTSYIGDLYLGGSIETGNVWDDSFDFSDLRLAGSLFVGYDTILGPFYIGLGMIDGGEMAGYFYLGRTF